MALEGALATGGLEKEEALVWKQVTSGDVDTRI